MDCSPWRIYFFPAECKKNRRKISENWLFLGSYAWRLYGAVPPNSKAPKSWAPRHIFRAPLKIPHHRRMAHQTRSFSRSKGSALRQDLWQTACIAPPFTTVTKERKQALCCARPASSPILRQLTLVPYSKVWLGFRSSLPKKMKVGPGSARPSPRFSNAAPARIGAFVWHQNAGQSLRPRQNRSRAIVQFSRSDTIFRGPPFRIKRHAYQGWSELHS